MYILIIINIINIDVVFLLSLNLVLRIFLIGFNVYVKIKDIKIIFIVVFMELLK